MPRGFPKIGSPVSDPYREVGLDQPALRPESQPTPALTAADFALSSTGEINAQIAEATEAHAQALYVAEEEHRQRLLDLMEQRRAAEDREAAQLDESQVARARRLAEGLRAEREAVADEPDAGPSAAVAAYAARIAPALQRAAEFEATLGEFEQEYGGVLNEIQEISVDEWIEGQPTGGNQAAASQSLAASILRLVQMIVEQLAGSRRNLTEQRATLQRIGIRSGGVIDQDFERELHQSLHELAMECPDTIAHLNALMRGLLDRVDLVRERKESVAGTPQAEIQYDTARRLARAVAAGSGPKQPSDMWPRQADVNYSVFDR